MPDLLAGRAGTLYIDAPKLTAPVTVTVVNPLGTTVVDGGSTTNHGDGRYSAALSAANLSVHGVYTATWTGTGGVTKEQTFTVGPAAASAHRLWDLRLRVAAREGLAIESAITDYDAGTISDHELAGGPGNYLNRWLMLHPDAGEALAGKVRRVAEFSGSALVLSSPFSTSPAPGDRYALFMVDPREIDAALRVAFREMAQRARVPITLSGLTLEEGVTVAHVKHVQVQLPQWITHVDTIWNEAGEMVPSSTWRLAPGRLLVMRDQLTNDFGSLTVGKTITIRGIRELHYPQMESSTIEIEPTALIARASVEVLASRAGGPGVDLREHLRRQLLATQEWEANVASAAGRMPSGARAVIP
jgi:hypothetical protein